MPFSDNPLSLFVRKLEAHAHLSEEDREAILAIPHRVRTCEPATYLTREGDLPAQCAVLYSGFAYRQKITGDGQRQIIGLQIPGEALDLQHLFLDVADHSVQMLTRGEVAVVMRRDIQDLVLARPAIGHAIMVAILIEGSIFREWVLNVGRRDARSRLAHLLCEFGSRMQAQGLGRLDGYELPITQEQLADALGLTPVHVNRTLKSLEASGLITRTRRHISMPSWERIREAGDFNQRYLHFGRQEARQAAGA